MGVAQAQVSYRFGDPVETLAPSFYAGQAEDGSDIGGRQAFFGQTSHDGKRIVFWAVNTATQQSGFFLVDVGDPTSFRRVTADYPNSPSAPVYWTPDDSAFLVGPYRVAIPPVGSISGIEMMNNHGYLYNDTSITALPENNWAFALFRVSGGDKIMALPILPDGSGDPSREPVQVTDFPPDTINPDWPCISPDGTTLTFADYHGFAGPEGPDAADVYVLKNIPQILAAPLKPGTNISSLAPTSASDSNVVAIMTSESSLFAHIPTFSQDKSLVIYAQDYNNIFQNSRFFSTFPYSDMDIMISNSDGSGGDYRLEQPGNQGFPSSTAGGIRIVFVSAAPSGAMHLFMSSIEVVTQVAGTSLPNNDVVTTAPQEATDGSGTTVTVPADTTIDFPDGAPQEIQVLTPVNPVEPVQLPPDVVAIPVLRDFGPDGTQFNPAITVTISYTDAEVEGLDENALRVFRFNPATQLYDDEVTTGIVRDTVNNRISFSVDHFSTYGLAAVADSDNDGFMDSVDPDDDNDGILDAQDPMPLDTNNNGVNNADDADDDSDGIIDVQDAKPLDTDNDGINNDADTDDDNDGIVDTVDAFLFDTDNDGQNNAVDADDDNDGLSDVDEVNTHHTDPLAADSDHDGVSDGAEVTAGSDPNVPDAPAMPVSSPLAAALLLAVVAGLGAARMKAAHTRVG
jgi:hypothetical protein